MLSEQDTTLTEDQIRAAAAALTANRRATVEVVPGGNS